MWVRWDGGPGAVICVSICRQDALHGWGGVGVGGGFQVKLRAIHLTCPAAPLLGWVGGAGLREDEWPHDVEKVQRKKRGGRTTIAAYEETKAMRMFMMVIERMKVMSGHDGPLSCDGMMRRMMMIDLEKDGEEREHHVLIAHGILFEYILYKVLIHSQREGVCT